MTGKPAREVLVADVRDAEVTIVGGGASGCAVAYVLAGAGYRDIQVVEQGELAGGLCRKHGHYVASSWPHGRGTVGCGL
jgi:glycine/D-amino acid oxidase-like deaminating enzyme